MNIWDGSDVIKDSGSCKVGFHPAIGYTVCVTVERFNIEDCDASVNYYHDGDSEIKAVCVFFEYKSCDPGYCMMHNI